MSSRRGHFLYLNENNKILFILLVLTSISYPKFVADLSMHFIDVIEEYRIFNKGANADFYGKFC